MGALGRHVAVLNLALAKIRLRDSPLSFSEGVTMDRVGRNNSLILGSGRTPSGVVFAKSDYFYPLDSGRIQADEVLNSEDSRIQKHLMAATLARSEIMKIDAQYAIRTCTQRNLKPGGKPCPSWDHPLISG